MAMAIFVGLGVFFLKARYIIEDYEKIVTLGIVLVISAFAGSWILFIVSNLEHYASLPWTEITLFGKEVKVPPFMEYLKGGMAFYGGVLGAMAGALTYGIYARLPLLETMDCFAPGLALGHAWGRAGCFLAGCCYGIPCGEGAGLCARFPRDSVAYMDLVERGLLNLKMEATPPLVPVQLLESGFELLLALGLAHLYAFRPTAGYVISGYFILYGIFRFVIEYFRFDPDRGSMLFFSTSQWISLLMIPAGLIIIGYGRSRLYSRKK